MEKTRYTNEPEPVLVQRHGDHVHVTVNANIKQTSEEPEEWEADSNRFWEHESEIDLDDVLAQPAAYLHYVPTELRRDGKKRAQAMLDKLRNGCPVVPVPSLGEGAAVCNRPADQVKLLAGLSMGGLPYFELADGSIVELSPEQIKAIAADVTAAETRLQKAKQACWEAIDAAGSWADITAALDAFDAILAEYRLEE